MRSPSGPNARVNPEQPAVAGDLATRAALRAPPDRVAATPPRTRPTHHVPALRAGGRLKPGRAPLPAPHAPRSFGVPNEMGEWCPRDLSNALPASRRCRKRGAYLCESAGVT